MSFYPIFEAARKGGEAKTVRDALIKKFPKKYMTHSSSSRIKNAGNVSSEEFRKDIEEVLNDLELEFNNIEIIQPGRNLSPKAQSDSFDTIHVSLKDSTKKDFGIILAALSGRTKTSTLFKEGMVCFFFSAEDSYEPFNKRISDSTEEYISLIERIIADIKKNGIKGLEKKDSKEIQEFLKNKLSEYDANILNSIFNAMSIGNWLKNSRFADYEMHRDKIFTDIKKAGAKITKIPEDKWCPMDIMLIEREGESEVRNAINEVNSESNKDTALANLNRLFINNIDKDPKDDKAICLAVSLKEASSQHGRAKSYIDSLDVSDKTHYNLSNEEKSWREDPEKILKEIIQQREDIQNIMDTKVFDYKMGGKDTTKFDGANPLGKYGSLKMAKFFVEYAKEEPEVFANLASYGLSLGVNPTFFKLTGSIDGEESNIKTEKFEAEGGVVLYDLPDISYDKKIWIIDNPKNSGIQLLYWVMFSGWVYYVQIQIRSSKGPNQVTQVDVEIEEFKKLKEV